MNGKKVLLLLIAITEWFSLPAQFVLHMQNANVSDMEAILRYFGYFTILTNLLVCIYASIQLFGRSGKRSGFFFKPSVETAITLYIVVVGLIYNIVLRSLWASTGIQAVLHDLLHTVSPLLMLVLWWKYVNARSVSFRNIPAWLIYPLAYTILTMIRGYYADWYPYPFLEVSKIGVALLIRNALMLLAVFSFFAVILVLMGKWKLQTRKRK